MFEMYRFILNFIVFEYFESFEILFLFRDLLKYLISSVSRRRLLSVWILSKSNEDSVFGYRHKSGLHQLTDFIGVETNKKRKRRTSFTPQALELLNAHFDRNTHPNGKFSCHLSFLHDTILKFEAIFKKGKSLFYFKRF